MSEGIGLLGLDGEDLAGCVSCGLCLPHCPTYRVTADERYSPRGRIALMRAVELGLMEPNDEWLKSMDTCIQCRGCETACPSGVQFGSLIADTQAAVAGNKRLSIKLRLGLELIKRIYLLKLVTYFLAILQRLGLLNSSGVIPSQLPLSLKRNNSGKVKDFDVVLFTGCVMDAWMPEVHDASQQVLESFGVKVVRSGAKVGCCGALHEHAGLREKACYLSEKVISAMPTDSLILVNSAGCGAMLKEYGELLGTDEAQIFSNRVLDIHEWLAGRIAEVELPNSKGGPVVIQDPCHLRHVQKSHMAVREVMAPFVDLVEMDDEGLCCGAGGAFSLTQPTIASQVQQRKKASIDKALNVSGAEVVLSANPGCAMYLRAAGYKVSHPMEVLSDYCNIESSSIEIKSRGN